MKGTFEKIPFCLTGENLNGKILISRQRNPEDRFRQFTGYLPDKTVPPAIKTIGKAENTSKSTNEDTIRFSQTGKTFMFLFRQ